MKHNIKTIEDILNAVNEDNVESFLKDFSTWLDVRLTIKGTPFEKAMIDSDTFKWIDDGENNTIINIKKVEK
jgi:hypothetical protein